MPIRVAALVDLLAVACAVNGVTPMLCPSKVAPATAEGLPAGVVILPVVERDPERVVETVFQHLQRQLFLRVAFVAGDAIGVSMRMYSTALGGLTDAAVIAARTPENSLAMIGVERSEDVSALRDAGWLTALAAGGPVPSGTPKLSGTMRFIDRRPRLIEIQDRDALTQAADHDRAATTRMRAVLSASDRH